MSKKRIRSPAFPSINLEDAIRRTERLYEKESKHPVPAEAAAKSLGYKDATGFGGRVIAALGYYGLVGRNKKGEVFVSADFEKYKFSPDENIKANFLDEYLRKPKVFNSLIVEYGENLPSNETLKYKLIQMSFSPDAADKVVSIFRSSVEFVSEHKENVSDISEDNNSLENETSEPVCEGVTSTPNISSSSENKAVLDQPVRAIPMFLPRGREAVLQVPRPFYNADREAIKKQLESIFTDDGYTNE